MDGGSLLVDSEDFESHVTYSYKQLLLQRIDFVPASSPDKYLEELKAKYKPLNVVKQKKKKAKSTKMLSTTKPDETDSAAAPKDGETSILSPKVILFNKEHLMISWNSVRGVGPGLVNLGNTCFLNSVVQCLTYTPPLANYLLSGQHKEKCQLSACALCQLQDHVSRALSASGGSIRPAPIIQHLKVLTKPFRIGRQEDAHEFLRYYVDSMQKSCLKGYPSKLDSLSKSTTLVHQLFGGYFRSQVKCLTCRNTSDTYDPLLDISVETKNCPTLGKALKKITKPDILDGDNKYSCPKCKTMTEAHKKFTLHSLPTVLTVQLKRFNYNNYYGTKISKHVSYPEYIDLRPFMSEPQGPGEWYHLYAVLVHSGVSCHSGHYYCFVLASNGAWYCMNDTHVSQVRLDTVLSQEAYLLFYIKDTNYRSATSYTCTMVTEPTDSGQEVKTASNRTGSSAVDASSDASRISAAANEVKTINNTNKLKRIPKLIIRKKSISNMVQPVDHRDSVDNVDINNTPQLAKSSTLFTPRSVCPNVTPHSRKSDSVPRSPLSPRLSSQPITKNTSILNYFTPTSSRDAGVQVGETPVSSEQMKRRIAMVTPFPVSPPAGKPVARVSPQPLNISPPVTTVHQKPVVNTPEGNGKDFVAKDGIKSKSPETGRRTTPFKPLSPIFSSSAATPSVVTTTVSPSCNVVTNVATATIVSVAATPSTVGTSPASKPFSPSSVCSPQLPTSSKTPHSTKQAMTHSAMSLTTSLSDTAVTDSEVLMRRKHKKKKKRHSTADYSGQHDGVSSEHKKKKKKARKDNRECDASDELSKKKKKVKHSNKDGVWIEKDTTPSEVGTNKVSPLKSPSAVKTVLSAELPCDLNSKLAEETIAQETVPLPAQRGSSLPRDGPVATEEELDKVDDVENKLRPFLISYYSSSGSEYGSPPAVVAEVDDYQKTTATPADDVFPEEPSTKVTTKAVSTGNHKPSSGHAVTAPNHWLGVSHILANISKPDKKMSRTQNTSYTVHHQKSHPGGTTNQKDVSVTSTDCSGRSAASKQTQHSVEQEKSTITKQDHKLDNSRVNRWDSSSDSYIRRRHDSNSSDHFDRRRSSSSDRHKKYSSDHVSSRNSQRDKGYSNEGRNPRRVSDKEHIPDDHSCSQQEDIGVLRRERHSSSSSRHDSSARRDSSPDDNGHPSSRWDGQQRNEVVKQLTSHQQHQLGDKVRSWSGEANMVDSSVAMGSKRHRDDWDQEYDAGHVKRVRRHVSRGPYDATRNPFQDYQYRKNFRRGGYNRYNRYEQRSGYRWRQPPYNASYQRRSHDADRRKRYRH